MNNNLISVKDYSKKYGITKQAVYSKIQRGILETEIKDNIKYIIDNIEQQVLNKEKANNIGEILKSNNSTVEQPFNSIESILKDMYEEKIKNLEEQLEKAEKREKDAIERAKEDKEQLYRQIEQSNILQMKAFETVKQLEHKTEIMEEELRDEKSKTWWQKLFKK